MDLGACSAAADLLARGAPTPSGPVDGAAADLLDALGYAAGEPADGDRAALLRLAGRFERLFRLPVPSAPGAVFLGGQVAPARFRPTLAAAPAFSVGGIGATLREAFERCVGEAAERLSFLAWGDEATVTAPMDQFHPPGGATRAWIEAGLDGEGEIDWLRLEALDGGETWLPLDLCLRRPAAAPPAGGWIADSTGCAAGACDRAALLGGLREVVERDAAALWWYGAMPPGDLWLGSAQAARVAALLQALGCPAPRLLDISSEFGLTVVVAVSGDQNGRGVALGFGSDADGGAAACRAILELCQVELGHAILRHKLAQAGGAAALAEPERRALHRLTVVDSHAWPQFTRRRRDSPAPATGEPLPAALRRHGYPAYRLPLTRPEIGIPAVRVVAPGLQGTRQSWTSRRLAQAVTAHGGVPATMREQVAFI